MTNSPLLPLDAYKPFDADTGLWGRHQITHLPAVFFYFHMDINSSRQKREMQMSSHICGISTFEHHTRSFVLSLVSLFPFLFLSGTKKYGLHLVSLQDLTCLPVLLSCHRRGFTEESPQLNSDGNTSNITKSAVWWLYDSTQFYHMVAMVQTLTQILFIIIIIITITTLL